VYFAVLHYKHQYSPQIIEKTIRKYLLKRRVDELNAMYKDFAESALES